MNDDTLIQELDADAGWEAARMAQVELESITGQRDAQAKWAAIRQPKLDAFHRICRVFIELGPAAQLGEIKKIIEEANRKSANLERISKLEPSD